MGMKDESVVNEYIQKGKREGTIRGIERGIGIEITKGKRKT